MISQAAPGLWSTEGKNPIYKVPSTSSQLIQHLSAYCALGTRNIEVEKAWPCLLEGHHLVTKMCQGLCLPGQESRVIKNLAKAKPAGGGTNPSSHLSRGRLTPATHAQRNTQTHRATHTPLPGGGRAGCWTLLLLPHSLPLHPLSHPNRASQITSPTQLSRANLDADPENCLPKHIKLMISKIGFGRAPSKPASDGVSSISAGGSVQKGEKAWIPHTGRAAAARHGGHHILPEQASTQGTHPRDPGLHRRLRKQDIPG